MGIQLQCSKYTRQILSQPLHMSLIVHHISVINISSRDDWFCTVFRPCPSLSTKYERMGAASTGVLQLAHRFGSRVSVRSDSSLNHYPV